MIEVLRETYLRHFINVATFISQVDVNVVGTLRGGS